MGYRYYQTHRDAVFPFGYGLSYTSFRQRIVETRVHRNGNVTVVVQDTNRGSVRGADVVEGYVHDPRRPWSRRRTAGVRQGDDRPGGTPRR